MQDSAKTATVDHELIRASLAGDSARFGVLVERYWSTAVALALAKTGDPVQAEDIAQESFVKAYLHLHTLRDPGRFAGWLSKIVSQEVANCLRARSRSRRLELPGADSAESAAYIPAAGNPGLTEEQRGVVRNAVSQLPTKLQEVVVLRFVTGLSSVEIARQLGKKPGTVRVWLHRAYEMLRRVLSPLLEEGPGP
jgi:RNA polymerase sigma-70 factor (ECF subfamily)